MVKFVQSTSVTNISYMEETFESALELIKTLIEDFKAEEKHYLSNDYQETIPISDLSGTKSGKIRDQ